MALDDRTLRYYSAVCESGSIRSAADQLALAPSAVSRTIAALERHLRTTLLERTARGVRPTEAGELLLRFAKDRAHLEELLTENLDELHSLRRGRVRVAAGEGFMDDLVEHGLNDFLTTYPGVSVEVTTGGTDTIRDLLLSDDVDLALALHPTPHRELTVVQQAPQPLHVICAPDHPLAELTSVTPGQLDGRAATVLPERFGLRTLTDQVQRTYGVLLDIRLVSNSMHAMVGFVLAGLGITLLPRFAVGRHLAHERLRAIPLTEAESDRVHAQLLTRTGRPPSYIASRLLEHCAQHLDSLNPH